MASYPSIDFPNKEIPQTFNKNAIETKALQSDNILTSSLNVLGPSTLNTLKSNTITNTGDLTSNTITSTGALTSNTITSTDAFSSGSITNTDALSSGSITNTGALTSNTITSTNLLTASNGFTVSSGTVSFAANTIQQSHVSGLSTILLRSQNATGGSGGNAALGTISTNILTINFLTNNQSPIFVTPTANFSLVLTNVPISAVNATYKVEIYISARFH